MEAPPEKSAVARSWLPPAVLVAVTLLVHLWLVANTQVTSRDSLGFARVALQFDDPNAGRPANAPARTRADVLRQSEHPPGYPLAVWLASFPVRAVVTASPADLFIRSAQVASLIVGLLLVLVQFRLGRELFGTTVGFLAALLFQLLPVAARTTSDGLSEGLFLLAIGTALLCGVHAIRGGRPRSYFGCGLATAAAYLVRPEGLLVGAAVGAVLATLWLGRRVTTRRTALATACLALGVMVPAGPYMGMVGGVTNKPTGQKLLRWLTGGSAPEAAVNAGPTATIPLLAAWYVPAVDGSKPLWVLSAFAKELGKSFHYAPAILAVIGLAVVWRRSGKTDPAIRVPIVYGAFHAGLLLAMASSSGYLSERHTLPLVFVGCLFAAEGMVAVAHRLAKRGSDLPRWAVPGVAALVVLSCLPPLLRPRHDDRLGHVLAGRWLADHTAAGDAIVDPFDWAQFYAGRTLYRVPPDPEKPSAFYAVVEEGKPTAPRSKLPRHLYATELARQGRPVYQWPEQKRDGGTKVVVYKVLPGEH